jgi:glycosyltransferase involved in cell wall biosynthesis
VSAVSPVNLRDGYALRVHHLLRELSREWSIALLAPPGAGPVPSVARSIALPALPGWLPTAGFSGEYGAKLRAAVQAAAADWRPSAVLVWPGMQQVALPPAALPPVVNDAIDCGALTLWRELRVTREPRRFASLLREAIACVRHERRVVRAVADTVVVGEHDAHWLSRISGRPVGVVPNGVVLGAVATPEQEAECPTVAFTGVLGYPPNVVAALYLADSIWPRVLAALPTAELVIAGRQPLPEITRLGERPGIRVCADVPDMDAVLRRAWLAAAPMRSGAGIKNKVLEAWAIGRAVVLSPLAANGLALDAEASRWIAASAPDAARLIVQLLCSADERRRAGAHARALAAAHHSWAALAQQLSARIRRAASLG